jgi:hypothetical protein
MYSVILYSVDHKWGVYHEIADTSERQAWPDLHQLDIQVES